VRVKRTCPTCGSAFIVRSPKAQQVYCSPSCRPSYEVRKNHQTSTCSIGAINEIGVASHLLKHGYDVYGQSVMAHPTISWPLVTENYGASKCVPAIGGTMGAYPTKTPSVVRIAACMTYWRWWSTGRLSSTLTRGAIDHLKKRLRICRRIDTSALKRLAGVQGRGNNSVRRTTF
jgi:hypothetical protein